jgi:hypothetical protein
MPGDIPSMEPVRFGSGDMQLDWRGNFVPKPKDPLKAENEHPGDMNEGIKSRKMSETSRGVKIAHERFAVMTDEWIVLKMNRG